MLFFGVFERAMARGFIRQERDGGHANEAPVLCPARSEVLSTIVCWDKADVYTWWSYCKLDSALQRKPRIGAGQ